MENMLSGIKVVDLTRNLSGPYCTMLLADMGADVVKIETPTIGDDTRKAAPFYNGESAYFMSVNRGKKSMTLNLKATEGKEILRKMIQRGDIFIENNRPGVMERLGFDYKTVAEINPGIIYASISGFGQSGPYKDKGAYDLVVQCLGGSMSITGNPGEEPVRVGYSIGDIAAGMFAIAGILGALHVRDKTGKGQYLDIAMLDSQVAILENAIVRYSTTGQIPQPLGTRHPSFTPFQLYMATDGYFAVCVVNDKQFKTLCEVLDLEQLIDDASFISSAQRTKNNKELNDILEVKFKSKQKDKWMELLEKVGIPCGIVNNIRDVIESPQVKARNMIVEVEHPVAGKVKIAGNPIKATLTPPSVQGPAPTLGQDTENVLKEIGYAPEEINRLRTKGIV